MRNNPLRKPRTDSKLDNLPDEQFAQLCDWLKSGKLRPEEILARLEKAPFYIETSDSALSRFYQQHLAKAHLRRRQLAVGVAAEIAEEARKRPGEFDAATVDALETTALELAITQGTKPSDVKQLFMLVLKAKDQKLKERQVSIQERRMAVMEAKETKATAALKNDKLSSEEKLAKINEIFGKAA